MAREPAVDDKARTKGESRTRNGPRMSTRPETAAAPVVDANAAAADDLPRHYSYSTRGANPAAPPCLGPRMPSGSL